jgi:hypothetical protein
MVNVEHPFTVRNKHITSNIPYNSTSSANRPRIRLLGHIAVAFLAPRSFHLSLTRTITMADRFPSLDEFDNGELA